MVWDLEIFIYQETVYDNRRMLQTFLYNFQARHFSFLNICKFGLRKGRRYEVPVGGGEIKREKGEEEREK